MMSDTEVMRTIDYIYRETNEQIWQVPYLHSAVFWHEWSEDKMAAPAT